MNMLSHLLFVLLFGAAVAQVSYEADEEYIAAENVPPEMEVADETRLETRYEPEYTPYEPEYPPKYDEEYRPAYKPEYDHKYQPSNDYKPDYKPEADRPVYQPEPYSPEPYKTAYKPVPYEPAYKPEPYQPESYKSEYKPEPYKPAYKPEPYQPEPYKSEYKPEPYKPADKPEPYKPEPYKAAYTPEPYKPAYKPEPYKPEPYKAAYTPEPYKPAYKPVYEKEPYGGYAKPAAGYNYTKPAYCDSTYKPSCASDDSVFCLSDYEYPKYEIESAIEKDYEFANKYSDVADQSADQLVDTISSYQEAAFNYDFFNPDVFDTTHWTGPEGYVCPSSVGYVRPYRGKNAVGQWRVIVQDVKYYTQTIRSEKCRFPDTACRLVAPCFRSACTQKYVYERMVSWDPCDPYQGLFIDVYKVPSACSCHVPE